MTITNGKSCFNSDHWWVAIEQLASSFCDIVNERTENQLSTGKLLYKDLIQVKNTYYKNLVQFKKDIYGKKSKENRIDVHKITALYIKSFLEVSPFYIESRDNREKTRILNLPNEYFSLHLMHLILMSWNDKKEKIYMETNERKWFIILMNHYRLNISSLDTLSLSQIVYFIEEKYFIK